MTTSCIDRRPAAALSGPLTALLATAVGVIVTNLFAPQPLVGLIGPALGLAAAANGLIAMATLSGYAAGLFLLVPLADLFENRGLVVRMLCCAVAAAALAAAVPSGAAVLVILFGLGAACSATQILVPIAAAMAPPERRGRVIGDVMSGLVVGVLLSRPIAGLVADAWGWRMFYAASAVAMAVLTILLAVWLPRRKPTERTSYPALIASLWDLLRSEPVLRQRALTASLVMAAFSVFWTAVSLRLAAAPYVLDQRGIAVFALAGAGGAIVTPLAGRAGDRGWTAPATVVAHLLVVAALGLAAAAEFAPWASWLPLVVMTVAAVALDIGVIGDQTLGRRAVNLLRPEARSRINGLFVGLFFLGGALGSAAAGAAWAAGGWPLTCAAGAAFAVSALVADALSVGARWRRDRRAS